MLRDLVVFDEQFDLNAAKPTKKYRRGIAVSVPTLILVTEPSDQITTAKGPSGQHVKKCASRDIR